MDCHTVPQPEHAEGKPESLSNKVLESAAAVTQNLEPVQRICAHLNAFHAYADEPGRCVEANHYCAHLNDEVRQCILYDSPTPPARIIGIGGLTPDFVARLAHLTEYMITARLFDTLDPAEQKLWHSHVFEVKSGMLIMPRPAGIPESAWELAENKEMEQVVHLYGKVYHLWQVDRGDQLPLGEPKLMTSFTEMDQILRGEHGFATIVGDRDGRFGSDWTRKKKVREYIETPAIHENADQAWK